MQETTVAACSFSRTFIAYFFAFFSCINTYYFFISLLCFRCCGSSGLGGSPIWKRRRKNSSRPCHQWLMPVTGMQRNINIDLYKHGICGPLVLSAQILGLELKPKTLQPQCYGVAFNDLNESSDFSYLQKIINLVSCILGKISGDKLSGFKP